MSRRTSKRGRSADEGLCEIKTDIPVEISVEVPAEIEQDDAMDDTGISQYEKVRTENIRRNEEFLLTLGLDKPQFLESGVAKSTPVSRRGSDSGRKKPPALPTRRSGRMTVEKLKVEVGELEGEEKLSKQLILDEMLQKQKAGAYEVDAEPAASWSSWDTLPRIETVEFSIVSASSKSTDSDVKTYVRPMIDAFEHQDIKSESTKTTKKSAVKTEKNELVDGSDYRKRISKLSVTEEEVAKMTESRVTSVWIHPATDKVLVGAGDKAGNLGIWDVRSTTTGNGGVFKFKPHVAGISKLHTYENEPSKLYSVSSDGTIRFLDLGKEAFMLGFTAPEGLHDISFNDASFSNDGNTVFLGKTDGTVGLVDFRSKVTNDYEWSFETQATKVNSVQQHPIDSNLLITAGSGAAGVISIHDIRKAGKKWPALKIMNEHTKSVNAAYCSPDGRYIVSVGQDSTIRTWKNFKSASEEAIWTATRHDNHTGRYV